MTPEQLFSPLIGQLVWNVSGGSASFLTLEFGEPHLRIREPVGARSGQSARVNRIRQRRLVTVAGDWHLFIEFAHWKITSANGSTSSAEESANWWKDWLDDISGQRLLSVESPRPGRLTLRFDLGGTVEIWPTEDIDNDVWTLHLRDGDIFGCRRDGSIERGA